MFTSSVYHPVYRAMLGLIEQIEGDPYHSVKFLHMRQQWAKRGLMEAGFDEDDGQESMGFKVHLD